MAGSVGLLLAGPARAEDPAPAAVALPPAARALEPRSTLATARTIDRVVARFTAPETGGVASPRFIFERELAFEARLEALTDSGFAPSAATPYLDRHVRSALERHMAETLLQSLEITPEPSPADLQTRMRSARLALVEQVGGESALRNLLSAEGLDQNELGPLLVRRARQPVPGSHGRHHAHTERYRAAHHTPHDAHAVLGTTLRGRGAAARPLVRGTAAERRRARLLRRCALAHQSIAGFVAGAEPAACGVTCCAAIRHPGSQQPSARQTST